MTPTMVSFFRRKKPDATATPADSDRRATDGGPRYSVEELAAAFPDPPAMVQPASPSESASPIPAVAAPQPTAVETPPEDPAAAAAPGRKGWRDRLRGSGFARGIGGLFARNPKLDDDLIDEIETALITADVGVTATTQLVESLRKRMKAREFADANALLTALRANLIAMLMPVSVPLQIDRSAKPFVLLTVGEMVFSPTATALVAELAPEAERGVYMAAYNTAWSLAFAAGPLIGTASLAQFGRAHWTARWTKRKRQRLRLTRGRTAPWSGISRPTLRRSSPDRTRRCECAVACHWRGNK